MALTLLMSRYMLYKLFIVKFNSYSSVHCRSCLTLCIVFYLFFSSENELSIDGKKHKLKKEESNNIGATNVKKEREENWSGDTLRANIPHKTHI